MRPPCLAPVRTRSLTVLSRLRFAPGPAIGRELLSLSEELLVRMLSYMDANDLSIVARINNEWNRLAQEPMVSPNHQGT